MLNQSLAALTINGELTGVVDLGGHYTTPTVVMLHIEGIASGARCHTHSAGYPAGQWGWQGDQYFQIDGDVRGAIEIVDIICPFKVAGSVYGGLSIGSCRVPSGKTSQITGGIASNAILDIEFVDGDGEFHIGDGIASGADVRIGSIEGMTDFHIDGGIAEKGMLSVENIGAWGYGTGDIVLEIGGDMAGELYIKQLQRNLHLNNVPEGGRVWIDQFRGYATDPFRASLVVANGMAGELTIGDKAAVPPPETADVKYAKVEIGTAQPQGLTGELRFTGSLKQDVDVTIHGNLHDPEDPQSQAPQMRGGHIIILGGFGPAQGEATITIDGSLTGPRPFIAVDYDGWDEPHRWQAGGTVVIMKPDPNDPNVPPLYLNGNTPTRHVWEITQCRGDMNNDGAVNVGDINPFIQALSYVQAYALAFPGLGALEDPWDPRAGSRVYHGDCNCDGVFDFDDINPFVELLYRYPPCCSHECPCPGGNAQGGGLPEPEYLAAKLAVNVKPELFDDLVALAAAAASVQTDPKLKVYWEKVHHALKP